MLQDNALLPRRSYSAILELPFETYRSDVPATAATICPRETYDLAASRRREADEGMEWCRKHDFTGCLSDYDLGPHVG
jgi:hypothetical protein